MPYSEFEEKKHCKNTLQCEVIGGLTCGTVVAIVQDLKTSGDVFPSFQELLSTVRSHEHSFCV